MGKMYILKGLYTNKEYSKAFVNEETKKKIIM